MTGEEWTLYESTPEESIPPDILNLHKHYNPSIMSYNHDNFIEGGILNSPPEGKTGGRENNYYILFEDTQEYREKIRNLPGEFIAEDIYLLAAHDPAFPDLYYNPYFYNGYGVRIGTGIGKRITFEPTWSFEDGLAPMKIGDYSLFKYTMSLRGEKKGHPG